MCFERGSRSFESRSRCFERWSRGFERRSRCFERRSRCFEQRSKSVEGRSRSFERLNYQLKYEQAEKLFAHFFMIAEHRITTNTMIIRHNQTVANNG